MLSVMRRHAGWGLKVILGVIIVSFVFFFGFNAIREESLDGTAIQVGKEDIAHSRYQFFYNNQYENFRRQMKEAEIPDFLLNTIRQSAERLVVQRSLMRQFSDTLGLEVTDQELAETIVKAKDFDPVEYKNYLQGFYRENGFSYEDLLREDILIQKFQNWSQDLEPLAQLKKEKEGEKWEQARLSQAYLPRVKLLDLWFQDFATKSKVQSFLQTERP